MASMELGDRKIRGYIDRMVSETANCLPLAEGYYRASSGTRKLFWKWMRQCGRTHWCEYCGCEFSPENLPTSDHIIPKQKGGVLVKANVAVVCWSCNQGKSTQDLIFFLYRKAQGGPVTRVVHCKKERFDVYIGRPSKWGNPFSHLEGTQALYRVATREEAISKYREWLPTQPHLMKDLSELRGKILSCWCYPKPCHGDVIIELLGDSPCQKSFSFEKTSTPNPSSR